MMGMTPEWTLAMVAVFAITLASGWQRSRIRRAVRDLSTAGRRALGAPPDFAPPESEMTPELARYAALYRRTNMIVKGVWVMALMWLGYVVWLIVGGA